MYCVLFSYTVNSIAYCQMALAMWGSYFSKGRIAAGVLVLAFTCFFIVLPLSQGRKN